VAYNGPMELAYRKVADTLAHFGAHMSDVVNQRVYVTSIDEPSAALQVRKAAYGGKDLPALSMVEISRLALPQLKFEVVVIARLDT
jgi:enamine deaminase RidA (YjgF/YER057c/UK114 family)